MKKLIGKLILKGNYFFCFWFSLSLILCCIVFLNPKTIEAFRDFGVLVWGIIPAMIYSCSIFLACCIIFFNLILSHFYSEIKKSIINSEYLAIVGTF